MPMLCGCGGMADALASGASFSNEVGVQVPSTAVVTYDPNHKSDVKIIGEGFGFLLYGETG